LSSGTFEPRLKSSPIPRRVRLLIYSQILNTFAFGYLLIYLTVYLVEANVIGAYEAGLILGLETVVVIVAGIPMGILSDRSERKRFLIAGNSLLPFALIIYALTTSLSWFLVGAVLAGLGEAASLGSWNSIIADQTDLSNRDWAFSLSFIVSNGFLSAGFALPLILTTLQGPLNLSSGEVHSEALLVLGLLNFAGPAAIWRLLRDYHVRPSTGGRKEEPGELKLLLKFSGMNGIIGLGAGLIIPLLGTWLLYKFAVPDTYSGPFLALSSFTIAFAAVASPRLSRNYGLFRSMLMTAGSSTLFMFSMAFIPNVYLAGGVYLARATLMNMASPLIDSYLMGIVHPRRRGLSSAIAAIVWRLPNSVTTVIGGYLLQLGLTTGNHLYFDLPWLGASGLYSCGIVLIYFNFRNVKPRG
jgi:MFS family permease